MTQLPFSDEDVEEAKEEYTYWQAIAIELNWKLHSWTYKDVATYFTDEEYDSIIHLTSDQRDDIMRALKHAYQRGCYQLP